MRLRDKKKNKISNVTKVPKTFKGKVSREEHGFSAQHKTSHELTAVYYICDVGATRLCRAWPQDPQRVPERSAVGPILMVSTRSYATTIDNLKIQRAS